MDASGYAGDVWLLQPVSPRLVHRHLAGKLGLRLLGFLPPSHVDVEGRVVMVCHKLFESLDDAACVEAIEESKWIAGWHKVRWAADQPPLSAPAFALLETLEGVTKDTYGRYRHSLELPPWPPQR